MSSALRYRYGWLSIFCLFFEQMYCWKDKNGVKKTGMGWSILKFHFKSMIWSAFSLAIALKDSSVAVWPDWNIFDRSWPWFFYKSCPNILKLLRIFWKIALLNFELAVGTNWATFGPNWATFHSNIWSHGNLLPAQNWKLS